MTSVILGLGSSLGDRLFHLRRALRLLRNIPGCTVRQVSPVYISDALLPDDAPPDWDMPYLNLAIRCDVCLPPASLLSLPCCIRRALFHLFHFTKKQLMLTEYHTLHIILL